MGILQNGWFMMDNPIKMVDLRVITPFMETYIYIYIVCVLEKTMHIYMLHHGYEFGGK